MTDADGARADRLAAALRRARGRRAARHRPGQRALADRLHRLQRARRRGLGRRAAVRHRLPLPDAVGRAARRRLGARDRPRPARGRRGQAAGPGRAAARLRRRAPQRPRRTRKLAGSCARASSSSPAGGAVEDAAPASRTPTSSTRSAPPRGWPTTALDGGAGTRSGGPHGARRRARPRVHDAPARRRGRRRSRRSSPAGAHGALPHAEPARRRDPAPGRCASIDWGAQLDGYATDCTRTFATGEVDPRDREIYDLVLRAQEAALAAVRPGPTGREVDAVARADHRRGRPRRALRPRARPRRRARGPRGPAAVAPGRRRARGRAGRDRRARRLRARARSACASRTSSSSPTTAARS